MLSIITINEDKKWDCLVKKFKNYDINYLSGYAKAFQLHGEGDPILVYYDDGDIKAIKVVMKRDITKSKYFKAKLPLNTWFDLSTLYGYGGFWIEGNSKKSIEKMYREYDKYCNEKGYVSEFTRFHLLSNHIDLFSGKVEAYSDNIIRSLDLPLDEIFMDFYSKTRTHIRKSMKYGLKIDFDSTGRRLDEFLDIYYGTMRRANAKTYYLFSKEFFEKINKLSGQYIYIHALYEGKVISTELVLYGTENCYSFLAGTNKEYFKLSPNSFLKYEIIKWAKQKGLKRFILGGGYELNDGIFKYKKNFAPNGVFKFYVGKKIFDEGKYNKLLKIRQQEKDFEKTNYFPAYRG